MNRRISATPGGTAPRTTRHCADDGKIPCLPFALQARKHTATYEALIRAGQKAIRLDLREAAAFLSLQKSIDIFAVSRNIDQEICYEILVLAFSISAVYEVPSGDVPFMSYSGCSDLSFAKAKSCGLKSVS